MKGSVKKAAILSYIKLGITNIGGLIVTPYIIKMLGNEEYGLYVLIGAFVGYLSILDLGLNNAIVRYVAQYQAEKNKLAEENFLAISIIIYLGIGLLLVVLGSVFYFNIENLFGSTLNFEQLEKAKWMMLILIVNIGFTLPGGAFTGICTGYEAFIFPRWLSIIKYILRVFLVVVILNFGARALGIVILDTILNFAVILTTIWFVFYKLKVTIRLHQFKWMFIEDIFGYSFWIFLYALVHQFQWYTGQVILGTHMSTVTVAVYGVGVMLGLYFTNFGIIITQLTLPKAVQSISMQKKPEILTNQMTKIGRISFMLMLFVFGGFVIIGQDFIRLWVGKTYDNAWYIAVGIMLVYIIPMAEGYANNILEAKKLLRFKTLCFLTACAIGMLIGGLLSYKFGELGMIIGLIIPLFISQWGIMNYYYYKKLNLNIGYFFKSSLSIFVFSGATITILYKIFVLFPISSWHNLIVKSLIYSIIFLSGMFIISNSDEKNLIRTRIRR